MVSKYYLNFREQVKRSPNCSFTGKHHRIAISIIASKKIAAIFSQKPPHCFKGAMICFYLGLHTRSMYCMKTIAAWAIKVPVLHFLGQLEQQMIPVKGFTIEKPEN
jgi:hypothetical protein